MPKEAIYPELVNFAKNDPAVFIGANTMRHLSLSTLQTALQESIGKVVTLAARPFAVRLDSTSAGDDDLTNPIKVEFGVDLVSPSSTQKTIFLVAQFPLTLFFSIGVVDENLVFKKPLLTIALTINDLRFEIGSSNDAITISAGGAKSSTDGGVRSNEFEELLKEYKLDATKVTQIEGMLLYGGLVSSIASTISTPKRIDLRRLFPGVSIAGSMSVSTSMDRKFLYIGCASGLVTDGCGCRDVGNGIGALQPGGATAASDSSDERIGKFRLGAPATVNPKDVLNRVLEGVGDAGIFIPTSFLDPTINGPYPALRVDASDNGFIGWRAAGIVDFDPSSFLVTFEPKLGRFFVDFGFRTEIYGQIHADFGKLGKQRIAGFSAEQAGPAVNECRVGFYLVVGTENVYFKPVLEKLSIADIEVHQDIGSLIGTCFGSGAEVKKYIINKIINESLAYALSRELDLALRRAMQEKMIPLLGAYYAAQLEGKGEQLAKASRIYALSTGDQAGFLISTAFDA